MSWKMMGQPFSTADISSTIPVWTQKFKVKSTETPKILLGINAGLIFYGNPVFTLLRAEIWNDPVTKLIDVSSNSYAKASVFTNTHAFKHVGFTFDKLHLKPDVNYNVTIRPTVYTGNSSSHIAWRHGFPDPQYTTNITTDIIWSMNVPYDVTFIVGDL